MEIALRGVSEAEFIATDARVDMIVIAIVIIITITEHGLCTCSSVTVLSTF